MGEQQPGDLHRASFVVGQPHERRLPFSLTTFAQLGLVAQHVTRSRSTLPVNVRFQTSRLTRLKSSIMRGFCCVDREPERRVVPVAFPRIDLRAALDEERRHAQRVVRTPPRAAGVFLWRPRCRSTAEVEQEGDDVGAIAPGGREHRAGDCRYSGCRSSSARDLLAIEPQARRLKRLLSVEHEHARRRAEPQQQIGSSPWNRCAALLRAGCAAAISRARGGRRVRARAVRQDPLRQPESFFATA